MDGPPPDYRLLRFWSDDYPIHVRLAAWQEVLGRKLLRADIEPLSEDPFQVDASLRILSDFRFGVGLFGPSILRRTRAITAADRGDFFFVVNLEGPFLIERGGTTLPLGEGEACFMACGQEATFIRPVTGRLLCARLRGEQLTVLVPGLEECSGMLIRRDVEPLRMFCTYLRGLDDNQALHSVELRRLVSHQVFDLAALVLNTAKGARAEMRPRALGALRLRAVKAYVEQKLDQPNLSIAEVATMHAMSPRHIQRFFKAEGLTFSEFVLAKRLQKVHAALCDPRQAHRSVSEIALSTGFGDVSHFNRAFRSHYGASPTEVRHKAVLKRSGESAPG